ncbi:MAG: C10 family peptidase, partial [Ignavibacteriales bacterium]|nr:C10 family peptidase [Ignavibacteriales bacterium]
ALPVHMATVTPANDAGHNFVVDGYNSENFFHLNFGWGGSYNGWYKIPEGIPYNLTVMEGTIVNIYPGRKQQDCNDDPSNAVLIQPSETAKVYKIDDINDVDWYRIKLYEGTRFVFHTEKFGLFNVPLKVWFYGPYGDADMKINDFRFTTCDDTSFGFDQPALSISISKTGYYYIRLSEKSNSPGTRPRGKNIGAYVFFADTIQTAPRSSQEAGRESKAALAMMNYPNPFNPATTISYSLPFDARVTLTVYNILGQVVATPLNAMQISGPQQFAFNGNELPSGMYIYTLDAVSVDGSESVKKVNKFILQK